MSLPRAIMRSQLTRGVFRRLLGNQGFSFPCPHRTNLHINSARVATVRSIIRTHQRRSLFGFSPKPEKGIKEADMDPGFDTILDLGLRLGENARPPDAKAIITALRKFIHHHTLHKEPINKLQAHYIKVAFRHLQQTNTEELNFGLHIDQLLKALVVMAIKPLKSYSVHHEEFVREVFAELKQRDFETVSLKKPFYFATTYYMEVLTSTGHTAEAALMLEELLADREERFPGRDNMDILRFYILTIKGFGAEGKEAEMELALTNAMAKGLPVTRGIQLEFIRYYAENNNVEKTKEWFEKEIEARNAKAENNPLPEALEITLRFAVRNNELDWLEPIFKSIIQSNPYKKTWDVMLLWAAEGLGKGPEDVDRMIDVMNKHQGEIMSPVDMDTFNLLIKSAVANQNPYLAERYIALAEKRGIRPNAETYIMQMHYRLDAGDFSGADVAYQALRGEDLAGNIDVPAINKYIRLLASAPKPDYDRAMLLIADLEERDLMSNLEADTVSALVLMHLKRGETKDTINSLQAVVFHLDHEDRDKIRDAILGFIYDRSFSTAQAWDAYCVIKQIFPETSREIRTQLMSDFFERRRSDMACYVFGHMRAHELERIRPTVDTYTQCFLGIAKCEDEESLRMVHNMMKMDAAVEPNTALNNSMMIAWTACGDAEKALDFWVDITNSREGPSYRSLEIVLRVCEEMDFGEKTAKEVWGTMRRMEIEITQPVANAYVGALAGQNCKEEAKKIVESMEEDLGCLPNLET